MENKKRILVVFGTRPEAIKMAPLVNALRKNSTLFETRICVTAQHREMLDQVLSFFNLTPDYDLDLMKSGQSLFSITTDVITRMESVYRSFNPDVVLVHGDTTTSFAASLSAYYCGVSVCHVEAGLRTYNKLAPFPEEINRQLTARIADYHYAPTEFAKSNLLSEGIKEENVVVTGNTVIDALKQAIVNLDTYSNDEIEQLKSLINVHQPILLVTGHRRENFGDGMINICNALKLLAEKFHQLQIVYPVHLNPNVQNPVGQLLSDIPQVKLIPPASYPAFVWLMSKSTIILTDSGGIQEEGPSIGKPVLVMRNTTERPEAVDAGTVKLVGTNIDKIVGEVSTLLLNTDAYEAMSKAKNPYGDGYAAEYIVNHLNKVFSNGK